MPRKPASRKNAVSTSYVKQRRRARSTWRRNSGSSWCRTGTASRCRTRRPCRRTRRISSSRTATAAGRRCPCVHTYIPSSVDDERRQPDGERGQQDVEGDDERELETRQQDGIEFHVRARVTRVIEPRAPANGDTRGPAQSTPGCGSASRFRAMSTWASARPHDARCTRRTRRRRAERRSIRRQQRVAGHVDRDVGRPGVGRDRRGRGASSSFRCASPCTAARRRCSARGRCRRATRA